MRKKEIVAKNIEFAITNALSCFTSRVDGWLLCQEYLQALDYLLVPFGMPGY